MRSHGLTVCVNYADLFGHSIERWYRGLDRLVVATTPADLETLKLCGAWAVETHQTDVFTADGATFNKAAAMCEAMDARAFFRDAEWILLFDADVVPPTDWRTRVEMAEPKPGNLYGAPRHLEDGRLYGDGELAGYFQLFHVSDPNARQRPLLDACWAHAGNYDSEFQARWSRQQKRTLPLPLTHLGEPGRNWWGRGNDKAMRRMRDERNRRGGYQHERIS